MAVTPNSQPRPWRPSEDFTEPCETCHAPAGQYCRPHCDTGYTAQDAQRDAERRELHGPSTPAESLEPSAPQAQHPKKHPAHGPDHRRRP